MPGGDAYEAGPKPPWYGTVPLAIIAALAGRGEGLSERSSRSGLSGAGAWVLFALLAGLTFLLVVVLAGRAGQEERLLGAPTAAPVVPAAALSDRHDWLTNGALRFADRQQAAPQGWRLFEVAGAGARVYRSSGESYLRLDCADDTCIAGLWQRLDDLASGDYLFEADVYLQPGGAGGAVSARLGYDRSGGVDPTDPGVVWSARARAEGWQRLSLELEDAGGPGTVFLALDALSPGADCRIAGVRLLGPPGQTPRPFTPEPQAPAPSTTSDVEIRAAYLRLSDIDLTTEQELTALLDGLAQARFNVVYLGVRKDGLAYYDSPLEPAAGALTGEGGVGLHWDPLARAVELGHERGLEVHAWVDLLPVWPAGEGAPEPPVGHMLDVMTARLGQEWLQPLHLDDRLMAAPAHEQVRAYLASLCGDLARRYAIDGMHLSGLAVTSGDEAAAQADLSALLEQVAGQVRGERPGAVVSVLAEPVEPGADVFGLAPSGSWRLAGGADVVAVAGSDDVVAEWRAGSPMLTALPVLDGGGTFDSLAEAIASARKSGALGVVIYDAGLLAEAGHWEALAAGPFVRPAEVPQLRGDVSPSPTGSGGLARPLVAV